MNTDPLIEANSVAELRTALGGIAAHYWQARTTYYLPYLEHEQLLRYRDKAWPLNGEHQPGACALTLRSVSDQQLPWPDGLHSTGRFRMSLPVFNWGSLNAVVLFAFDSEPGELIGLPSVQKTLGSIGEKVIHRQMSAQYIERCKELMVQAVEAQGKSGHVERVSRLSTSLAAMLDLSEQVQGQLTEAAGYHDIGRLTFTNPSTAQADSDHPKIGAGLLRAHPDLGEVASLVEVHHERYDGSGLPKGLAGDEVPMEGWVLCLAEDVVEQWEGSLETFETKVRRFFNGSAKHHHPDVVDALCGLVDSGKLQELL